MRIPFIVLLLLTVAGAAEAQVAANPLNIAVGDHIRLREPLFGGDWVVGRVAAISRDEIAYSVDGGSRLERPYVAIDTIDVRRRLPRQSALQIGRWGAFLGGAAGMIAGPLVAKSMPSMSTGTAVAAFGAGGTVTGGLIGAAIGAILVPPQWYRHVLR